MLAMDAPNGSNDPANAILSLLEESKDWPPTWLDVYSTTSSFSLFSILGLSTVEYECFLSKLGIKEGSRGFTDRIKHTASNTGLGQTDLGRFVCGGSFKLPWSFLVTRQENMASHRIRYLRKANSRSTMSTRSLSVSRSPCTFSHSGSSRRTTASTSTATTKASEDR